MKTITLDYNLYQQELKDEYNRAEFDTQCKFEKMLKAVFGASLQELREKFSQYEELEAERAIRNYKVKGYP